MNTQISSLRTHPELKTLFKEAEGRFLNEDELDVYLSVAENGESKAEASREVKSIANQVIKKVLTRIFELYPYATQHNLAMGKCIRDMRYVLAYGTNCMLAEDPDWYRDKLLVWMKTIIQSFDFPDIAEGTTERYFNDPETVEHVLTLTQGQRSIYETYKGILEEMRANLSEATFSEMEHYLNLSLEILSHD
ncbi:MAG: hypothetical protein AAF546_00510 [Verrucomicrobiota bacterium]